MEKIKFISLSKCGNYIASLLSNETIKIYKIKGINSTVVKIINLNKALVNFFTKHNIQYKFLKENDEILQFEWEETAKNSKCQMLAIVIKSSDLLIIYDLKRKVDEPIIIEQLSEDGIEKIQWINKKKELTNFEISDKLEAKKEKSNQIIIFTKKFFKMQLYLLKEKSFFLTLSNPITKSAIIKPNTSDNFWMILTNPSSKKNSTIVSQFYNEGSYSFIFRKFMIKNLDLYRTKIEWSKSGFFFSCFNKCENLFGFNLKIYSALGYPFLKKNSQFSQAIPVINIDWVDHYLTNLKKFPDLNFSKSFHLTRCYFSNWFETLSKSEFLIVIGINNELEIEFLLVSLNFLSIINKTYFKVSNIVFFWIQSTIGYSVCYNKIKNQNVSFNNLKIQKITIENCFIFIQFEKHLIVFKIIIKKDVDVSYKIIFFLISNLNILKTILYNNKFHNELLIVFDNHVAKYMFEKQTFDIIYQDNHVKINSASILNHESKSIEIKFLFISFKQLLNSEMSQCNWKIIKIYGLNQITSNKTISRLKKPFADKKNNNQKKKIFTHKNFIKLSENDLSLMSLNFKKKNDYKNLLLSDDELTDTFQMKKKQKTKL